MRTPIPCLPWFLLLAMGCQSAPARPPAAADEAHVSPAGSNRFNDGSRRRPFESLKAALAAERHFHIRHPGQTFRIHLHGGAYFLDGPIRLGPEDSHTVFAAWPGEKPLLLGGEKVALGQGADGAWRIACPAPPEHLLINGTARPMACEPDQGFFRIHAISRQLLADGGEEHRIQVQGADLAALTALFAQGIAGARVEVLHKWDTTLEPVSAWDAAEGVLVTRGKVCKPWNALLPGCRLRIWNAPGGCNAPGEWIWQNGAVRYLPKPGETLGQAQAVIPQVRQWVLIEGRGENNQWAQDIHFLGLDFAGTTTEFPAGGFPPGQAAQSREAGVMAKDARRLSFTHCSFRETAEYGLWLRQGCTDCRVTRSTFEHLGAGGVRIGETAAAPKQESERTGHIQVENCRMVHGGLQHLSAVGVLIGHSGDNRVAHNEIGDFGYTGISVGWVWGYAPSEAQNNTLAFNHIHHIGSPKRGLLDDMGGIYTLGAAQGTRLEGNWIHDIRSDRYGGWGIYNDEGSAGITVENNLVHDTEDGGYHQHYGRDNVIRNNIFAFGRRHAAQGTRQEDHRSLTFTHNLVVWQDGDCNRSNWSKMRIEDSNNLYWRYANQAPITFEGKTLPQLQATGREAGSVTADPLFVDAFKRNFKLKPDSPAFKLGFKEWDFSKAGVQGE